jgi:hypothetical protein
MLPFRSWHAGRNGVHALFLLGLLLSVASDSALAEKGKGKQKTGKKKASPSASTSASASGSPGEQSLTNIPLPVGHEAKGLVLPDFDLQGHLRGKFVAAGARRLDEEQVAFTDLKITTFTEDNELDLEVDLHTAIFNLKSRILSSKEQGTVKRADFNIIGDTLDFDTDKRTGHMVGHVHMIITSNSKLIEEKKK